MKMGSQQKMGTTVFGKENKFTFDIKKKGSEYMRWQCNQHNLN